MPSSIPAHVHGSSKYYYRLGCTDPACVKKANEKRNAARRKSDSPKSGERSA